MPANALHSCTTAIAAQNHIKAIQEEVLHKFLNEKNEEGQAPIHALMRLGPEAREVIKYLITLPEVDINAVEDNSGMTIAHLCEDADIMCDLVKRQDFNPNILNHELETPLIYGLSYHKHPNIMQELLKCPRLDLPTSEELKELQQKYQHPRAFRSLEYIREKLENMQTARVHTETTVQTNILPMFNAQDQQQNIPVVHAATHTTVILQPPHRKKCCCSIC